jgi:hypothetical protein
VRELRARAEVQPDGMLPLARALSSRSAGGPGTTTVEVKRLSVGLADLAYVPAPGVPPAFEATGGTLRGSLQSGSGAIRFDLVLDLNLVAPAEGPAHGAAAGTVEGGVPTLQSLDLELPGGIHLQGGA